MSGFALLLLFQYLGQSLARLFGLPLPGAVAGFFLLTVTLLLVGSWRRRRFGSVSVGFAGLDRAGGLLLRIMPMLFIPAGVGIVTQLPRLQAQWLPVLLGLAGSTLITFAVSALLMQRLSRRLVSEAAQEPPPTVAR